MYNNISWLSYLLWLAWCSAYVLLHVNYIWLGLWENMLKFRSLFHTSWYFITVISCVHCKKHILLYKLYFLLSFFYGMVKGFKHIESLKQHLKQFHMNKTLFPIGGVNPEKKTLMDAAAVPLPDIKVRKYISQVKKLLNYLLFQKFLKFKNCDAHCW